MELPIDAPLTATQAELTSKIISMNNLLGLPFSAVKNIPKHKQLSTFDYLKKILYSMGLSPEQTFGLFFSEVLGQGSTFLEDAIIDGMALQLMWFGKKLPGETFDINAVTSEERDEVVKQNTAYIKGQVAQLGLTNFMQVAKQKIAKDLVLVLFGPKDGPAASYLNSDPVERARLIDNAVCAAGAFSVSNDPIVRDEDLEYNRIALRQQLEAGRVTMEISCQNVHISLPEDPSFIFVGGGQYTIPSAPVTPAQSLDILARYVSSQTQQINNEANSNSAGKSFYQIMIETFLSNITNLVAPYMGPIVGIVNATPAGANFSSPDLITNTCEILNGTAPQNKKKFGEKLSNELYKKLINFMLILAIREFKKMVKNYFARLAREKAKRRAEKAKNKFAGITENLEKAKKTENYLKAASTLQSILGDNLTNIT